MTKTKKKPKGIPVEMETFFERLRNGEVDGFCVMLPEKGSIFEVVVWKDENHPYDCPLCGQ